MISGNRTESGAAAVVGSFGRGEYFLQPLRTGRYFRDVYHLFQRVDLSALPERAFGRDFG